MSKNFLRSKKEYGLLIGQLKDNPTTGIPIGDDCYKIRIGIASKNKGKSGGARVITYFVVDETTIFLLTIYDKSEQENISAKELKSIIKAL